ncbi:hypothetical protein [Salinicola halophyticus]|uniref:hypothetical protein n=1 Tax=Salinicola halophyticus TaxID=1808881 RepID=UPI003F45587D
MWFIDVLASLATIVMNNRKAKYAEKFAAALSKYVESPEDSGRRFLLEQVFCQIYRKKASAELIRKMAKSSKGPFETFDIYARSSLGVRCNYDEDSMRMPSLVLTGATGDVLKAIFGLMAAVCGIFCLVFSVVPALSAIKAGVFLISVDVQDISYDMAMEALAWMSILFAFIVFTVIFFFLSSLFLLTDRTREAFQLAEEINKC